MFVFFKCFVSFCSEPNDESGANVDASVSSLCMHTSRCSSVVIVLIVAILQKMWRDNRQQFNEIAQTLVRKSLGL